MTAEARIQQTNDQLIRLLSEDPSVDYDMLEKLTLGLITKDAKEGNGIEMAKWLYRYNKEAIEASETIAAPPKRRGRKPGVKNKATTTPKAKAAPKAKTAALAPAKKKRGRPKGSKNKTAE